MEASGAAGYVTNAGTITSDNNTGVLLNNGGTVNNQHSGSIYGADNGVDVSGGGSVINAGTVTGAGGAAVVLENGGSVNNQLGGNHRGKPVWRGGQWCRRLRDQCRDDQGEKRRRFIDGRRHREQ